METHSVIHDCESSQVPARTYPQDITNIFNREIRGEFNSTTLTGCQRSTNDFGTVDHRHDLSLHVLANRLGLVVAVGTLFQYLDAAEGRAGQDALLGVGRVVQEADVAVQVGAVRVAQSFDVALEGDGVAQVVVLRGSGEALDLAEDGVVDDDAVDGGVVVGGRQGGLDVDGVVDGAQLVPEAVGAAGLAGPLGVLAGGRVGVGEQSNEERGVCRRDWRKIRCIK
jgi:hypothetical protein